VQVDGNVRDDLMRRLHRAEGQLRGVMAMLESGRDCVEVLTQLVAVSHAVNGASFTVLVGRLRDCVRQADEGKAPSFPQLEKLFLSLA
jgi:DNA-binding FrmR family transcriptional regulator